VEKLNFTAIDFETANSNPNSACALGLVVVQAGVVVDSKRWLIRPPSSQFEFTYIHGITWRDVAMQPDFGQLWPQFRPYLAGQVLAAHNARFDLSVLFALFRQYRVGYWRGEVVDSLAVARRIWPMLNNHQLQTVAAFLSIPLDHHDAVSDAKACAQILCLAEQAQTGVIGKLARRYGEVN